MFGSAVPPGYQRPTMAQPPNFMAKPQQPMMPTGGGFGGGMGHGFGPTGMIQGAQHPGMNYLTGLQPGGMPSGVSNPGGMAQGPQHSLMGTSTMTGSPGYAPPAGYAPQTQPPMQFMPPQPYQSQVMSPSTPPNVMRSQYGNGMSSRVY